MAKLKRESWDHRTIKDTTIDTFASAIRLMMDGAKTKNPGADFAEIVRTFLISNLDPKETEVFWSELRDEFGYQRAKANCKPLPRN